MWVPEGESVPIQVKVTRTSGDYNEALYSDVQMNPPLPDSAFELKLPAGRQAQDCEVATFSKNLWWTRES